MSLTEFLRNRGLSESLIKNLEEEKVDCTTIPLMSHEDLQLFFPKHGDRIAVKDFCKKYTSSKKRSLIEKLKDKLNKKGPNKENQCSSNGFKGENHKKSLKSTRIIEIGWLCTTEKDTTLRQVRTKAGGGTRKLSVPKECSCKEVLEIAKNLFFPNGVSVKGNLKDFGIKLLDYKSHDCDLDLTIQQMYDISALTMLRFYLGTTYKNEDNEETYIPPIRRVCLNTPETTYNEIDPVLSLDSPPTDNSSLRRSERLNEMPLTNFYQFNGEDVPSSALNFEFPEFFGVPENTANNQTLIVHRGNIFDDLINAFEQDFFDVGYFKLELILPTGEKELAEDLGGVWRDVLSEFWNTFYEKCTVGTTMKVPYIRHDFGECQWRAIAKIFLRGYHMEKYLPIKLSPVFLKTCFNVNVLDEDLINDFFYYICDTDHKVLQQASENFEEVDEDEVIEIFNSYESKWHPNKTNFKQLLRDIAHKELIQKPAFVVKCFQKAWENKSINYEEMLELYDKIKPTVKNCLSKIELDETNITAEQNSVFNYLKKYIKEADDKSREAFFRFCTGSNLPIMKIKVAFTETTGLNRLPIAHTCSGLLQLSSTYENFVTLRSELNSVLASNIWIMDII